MICSSRCRQPVVALALVTTMGGLASQSARAHCDTVDGPVVTSAREALAEGDATPVLKWVGPDYEVEILAVFDQAFAVRSLGNEARELADRFFFETLVRLHREGEGYGFSGLKPTGSSVSPAVLAADLALDTGSVDDLVSEISGAIAAGVQTRFARARGLRARAEESVIAGREFVTAYVEFTHYVEGLEAMAAGHPGEHGAVPATNGHGGAYGMRESSLPSSAVELPREVGAGPGNEVLVLLDDRNLKLAVLTLRGGTVLPSHSAPVPTTIQVIEGEGIIHIDSKPILVSKGSLVSLQAGVAHDVEPNEGSDMQLLVHYLRSAGPVTLDSEVDH